MIILNLKNSTLVIYVCAKIMYSYGCQFFIKYFSNIHFAVSGEMCGFKMKYVEKSRSYPLFIHDNAHIKT